VGRVFSGIPSPCPCDLLKKVDQNFWDKWGQYKVCAKRKISLSCSDDIGVVTPFLTKFFCALFFQKKCIVTPPRIPWAELDRVTTQPTRSGAPPLIPPLSRRGSPTQPERTETARPSAGSVRLSLQRLYGYNPFQKSFCALFSKSALFPQKATVSPYKKCIVPLPPKMASLTHPRHPYKGCCFPQ